MRQTPSVLQEVNISGTDRILPKVPWPRDESRWVEEENSGWYSLQ